jgi:deoxyribonuclease (pyrimidine dimer)
MTRINLVEPEQLTDKHLLAEYKELPRIFTAVRKLVGQGKTPDDVDISEEYVLGTGHCKFFYNKLRWLGARYTSLYVELKVRGFNLDDSLYLSVLSEAGCLPLSWQGNYKPSPEEIYLNMARLAKRSKIDRVLDELKEEN